MFKTIWFAKRKPGLSLQAYIDYYETHHVPLGETVMGDELASYVRHYLRPMTADAAEPAYDSVTEICFHDHAAYERVVSRLWNDKASADAMVRDQEQFIDMRSMSHFAVEDRASTLKERR